MIVASDRRLLSSTLDHADAWIAATAKATGYTLMTNDKDFDHLHPGHLQVLFIDPDTNLITKQTYVASGPGQPLVEEIFSDYRVVDGVRQHGR